MKRKKTNDGGERAREDAGGGAAGGFKDEDAFDEDDRSEYDDEEGGGCEGEREGRYDSSSEEEGELADSGGEATVSWLRRRSLVMRSRSGTVRQVTARHRLAKLDEY